MEQKREIVERKRKIVTAGVLIGIAVLIPLGRWVIASRQEAAAAKVDQVVEQQFIAARQANGQMMPQAQSQWRGGQGGGNGGNGPRRGGNGGQRGQGRQRRMEQMVKEVGLNPTQAKQVQTIRQSARSTMTDIFRNPNLTREQKRAQGQQIRQAVQEQLNKVLTTDQQTKYAAFQEKMRQERAARRQQNGGGFGGPGGGPGFPAGGNGGNRNGGQ
jgi:hypothetical protein